jgi:hypothetical protein
MLSVKRTRRWKASNGMTYEEEEEVVHMNAGSGGKKNATVLVVPVATNGAVSTTTMGDASGGEEQQQQQPQRGLQPVKVEVPVAGGSMYYPGHGGFTWHWRRRLMRALGF